MIENNTARLIFTIGGIILLAIIIGFSMKYYDEISELYKLYFKYKIHRY